MQIIDHKIGLMLAQHNAKKREIAGRTLEVVKNNLFRFRVAALLNGSDCDDCMSPARAVEIAQEEINQHQRPRRNDGGALALAA